MEWITGELRKLADLKAAKAINDEEHEVLRKKILEGGLSGGPAAGVEKDLAEHFADEALKKHQAWRHAFEDFKLQEAAWRETGDVSQYGKGRWSYRAGAHVGLLRPLRDQR